MTGQSFPKCNFLNHLYRFWWVRAPHAVLVPKKSIGHDPPFAKSEWQGRVFLKKKVEPRWLGRALLEKFVCSVKWDVFFRETSLSGWREARTSRGSCSSGWLGRVNLEKMACRDDCGAYPRESLRSRLSVWRVSLLVLDYSYHVQLVWMGRFQDSSPQGGIVLEQHQHHRQHQQQYRHRQHQLPSL